MTNSEIIDPDQVFSLVRSGALLFDVRTQEEYQEGTLPNAILVPHDQISENIKLFGEDLDREIVVFCKSGGRSGFAAEVLTSLGYKKVYNGGGYKYLLPIFDI